MKYLTVVILTVVNHFYVSAQIKNNWSYHLSLGGGYIIETTNFLRGNNVDNRNIDWALSFSFEMKKHVSGVKAWHHYYNNLHYGAGLYHTRLNYSKNIGNPSSAYLFFGFSPFKTKKTEIITDIGLGLSGIWDYYSTENIHNDAVSMPVEAHVHFKLTWEYNFSPSWAVNVSSAYVHFSNGALKKPNFGLNIPQLSIGMTYYPNKTSITSPIDTIEKFKPWNQIINVFYGRQGVKVYVPEHSNPRGNVQKEEVKQESFSIIGIDYRFQKRFSFSHSLGFGVEALYNNSYAKNEKYYMRNRQDGLKFEDKIALSTFICYEYHINRFSILLEPGVYLRKYSDTEQPILWQRIGARYYFPNRLFAEMSLRAYSFRVADFLQFSLGYRI